MRQSTHPDDLSSSQLCKVRDDLTDEQRELLQLVWEHYAETGKEITARDLQLRIGRKRISDVLGNVSADLVYESTSAGIRVFGVTALGVLMCKDGKTTFNRFVEVLNHARDVYSSGTETDVISASWFRKTLQLGEVEEERGFCRFLALTSNLMAPIYVAGWSDGGEWSVQINDRIIDLYLADSVEEFSERLFLNRYRKELQWQESARMQSTLFTSSSIIFNEAGNRTNYFINPQRLDDLRSTNCKKFDTRRLVAMCVELNDSASRENVHAVAMLSRAILDHIPPIFDCKDFSKFANNSPGGSSFKAIMRHLDETCRNVANIQLHQQIGPDVTLPNMTQVNFSQGLDVLLSEVIKKLKELDSDGA